MRQPELMDLVKSFKITKKGVLLAVVGGRISEGMDFPDEELEVAVLVGIPYPRPTAKHRALEHYYEVKFVPPTLQLGPNSSERLIRIKGFSKAINNNKEISPERKAFLLKRLDYWKSWERKERNWVSMLK